MDKEKGIHVNDGNGLYDNQGICDTLIGDLNNLVKNAVAGQFIQCSNIIVNMTKKLANLKKGIASDLASKDRIIEELKRINDELVSQTTGLPVERGDNVGTD